ncbi:MAG: TlpA disulfide reductase family protein [Candidatus Omnitrophota bacterium]
MEWKRKFWFIPMTLVLFLAAGLVSCQPVKTESGLGMAPDFTLNDLDGKPFRFSSTRGKVVILDFWATWCPPCKAEIPHFVELYMDYKRQGLEIVGVSLDRGGAATVMPFARQFSINYPIVIDDQKVTQDYGGIRAIPTTFVIDRQGRIVEKFVGYRGKEILEEAIKKLL